MRRSGKRASRKGKSIVSAIVNLGQNAPNLVDVQRWYCDQQRLDELDRRLGSAGGSILNSTNLFLESAANGELDARRTQLNDLVRRRDAALSRVLGDRERRIGQAESTIARIWRSAFPKLIVQRLQDSTPEVKFRTNLDAEDMELVRVWHGGEPRGDDKERLKWARKGEKAAIDYYERLNCTVEDVSIRQLRNADSEWKRFDLRVYKRPLDVKNIRCDDPERFGEQMWKRAKKEKNDDVSIVGTVSIIGQSARRRGQARDAANEKDRSCSKKTRCSRMGCLKLCSLD